MSFTYNNDPGNSVNDEVRFLLGDVKETADSLSDEELAYLIALNQGDAYQSASEAAGRMAVRFLQKSATMKMVGDLRLQTDYAGKAAEYRELQRVLRAGRTMYDQGSPYWADTSSNQFSIGMMDSGYIDPRRGSW